MALAAPRVGMGAFRDDRAERRFRRRYLEVLEALDASVDRRWMRTAFGETHALACGPRDAPAVYVLATGLTYPPMVLHWLDPVRHARRVIVPDLLGQPGFSDDQRPAAERDGYAGWMASLMDAFDHDRAAVVGVSFGGGPALETAGAHPDRVTRLGLVTPTGFGLGWSPRFLINAVVPWLAYRTIPASAGLERLLTALYTAPDALDEPTRDLLGTALRAGRSPRGLALDVDASTLAAVTAPTFLGVAERDVVAPPDRVLERAREHVDDVEVVLRMPGQAHVPAVPALRGTARYLEAFLASGSLEGAGVESNDPLA